MGGHVYGITVVMVPQMCAYLQTHQVVHINYVQLFGCQSHLIRVALNA